MLSTTPIGYLVPEFPSQTHAFFWREVGALEEAGHPVQILSTRRPPDDACPHAFADLARERTIYLFPPDLADTTVALAQRPRETAKAVGYILGLRETPLRARLKLLALVPTAMGLLRMARQRGIRHVHIHSCANAAHLGALAYLLGGLNYSLTLHGDLSVYGTDHRDKMRHARFVSAVTQPLQKVLETEIGHDQAYPLIWMGVDTERFRPADGREPRDPVSPFRVLTVARLNAKKGHVFFLRAMARLCAEGFDIHYRIAGDGPARSEIEKEVSALSLEDRVSFLGSVSEDQVIELVQESDAGALTSFGMGEAAPVSVMEAMACGVPCIVSVIGGTPDMIDDGVDGILVPQKDDTSIAEALRTLITNPALLEEMSRAARHTATIKFDHRKNALKLYAAIEATASGPDTP